MVVDSDEELRDLFRRQFGEHLSMDETGKVLAREAAEQEAKGNARLADELRKKCESLIGFTEFRYSRYVTAPHHALVAQHLERVERREIDRLIIEMPPRHGKSELASKSYPAWCIGRNPTKRRF